MDKEHNIFDSCQESIRRNLTSFELLTLFETEMKVSNNFTYIDGRNNPCHILFEEKEYYVYIKNLSSAYFKNPDISRAQLTGVDCLNQIKESDAVFVMLGYDNLNKVFAVWNPYIVKQRIGTASSPSMYSRFSWQKQACEKGDFIRRELKNDGSVLLFPQGLIGQFFLDMNSFFDDTLEYVAMGSKRRIDANGAYHEFVNTQHLVVFGKSLESTGLDTNSIQKLISSIRTLINNSIISKHRKIFLACDTLREYRGAINEFLSLNEIKALEPELYETVSYVLPLYIEFLINESVYEKEAIKGNLETLTTNPSEYVQSELELKDIVNEEETDYESPYINSQGILTQITNPQLIELLRDDLNTEYPRPMAAYATVEEFYGDRFPNMEMYHWQDLFKKIEWHNSFIPLKIIETNIEKERSTRKKIRVVLSNGTEICCKQVVDTLIEVIKYAGVEMVRDLNITMGKNNGAPLINTTINQNYASGFKELGNGLYANTCSNTTTKFLQIQKINDLLNLNMKIYLE